MVISMAGEILRLTKNRITWTMTAILMTGMSIIRRAPGPASSCPWETATQAGVTITDLQIRPTTINAPK